MAEALSALAIAKDESQYRQLSGTEKAAVLLLALGEENGRPIWEGLDELEIKQVSLAMAELGAITPQMLEDLMVTFVKEVSMPGGLSGNVEATERLLTNFLPGDRVAEILDEIRGPAGRTMWEKLSNVQENVLANYLKNEYPQTVAVVLSKLTSEHSSRVLAIFPEEFAMDVINRMLRMDSVQKDILERIEQTLRHEFMSTLSHTQRQDSHEMMADIFNNFDRQTETRLLTALEDEDRDAADKIKNLMFTFDDLINLDAAGMQVLLRNVEKDKMAIALKGSNAAVRDFFFSNMSSRAGQMLQEDMEALGPIRLSDVDEAQGSMVNMAKDMAARGEIMINKDNGDDEIIY